MQSAGVAKKVLALLKPEAQHLINIKKLFNCESIDITVLGSLVKRVTKCRSQGTSPAPWESHTSWRMSFRKKGLWTCKISFKDLSATPSLAHFSQAPSCDNLAKACSANRRKLLPCITSLLQRQYADHCWSRIFGQAASRVTLEKSGFQQDLRG